MGGNLTWKRCLTSKKTSVHSCWLKCFCLVPDLTAASFMLQFYSTLAKRGIDIVGGINPPNETTLYAKVKMLRDISKIKMSEQVFLISKIRHLEVQLQRLCASIDVGYTQDCSRI